ncbi:protein of unassigned function [Methylobacterium oryzae CBMB20]|uniref:Protein of unassigned function n=1 Tax=Methylobacterium oryzae CBMB20 TaxID=693986 RepID=A0A089NZ71_9HYPH|nr:protein of unassigned function [Methylobacterium oryzae CBMB20]
MICGDVLVDVRGYDRRSTDLNLAPYDQESCLGDRHRLRFGTDGLVGR